MQPIAVRDLEGKVALVTRRDVGIGKAAAIQLAAQGATVIVHGRDADRGAAVVARSKTAAAQPIVGADLGEPAEALRLARDAGDVDILSTTPGSAWFGPSAMLDGRRWNQLFAANVQAPTWPNLTETTASGVAFRQEDSRTKSATAAVAEFVGCPLDEMHSADRGFVRYGPGRGLHVGGEQLIQRLAVQHCRRAGTRRTGVVDQDVGRRRARAAAAPLRARPRSARRIAAEPRRFSILGDHRGARSASRPCTITVAPARPAVSRQPADPPTSPPVTSATLPPDPNRDGACQTILNVVKPI